MSYIDSFDHEYIGHLGYLPLYHSLVEVEGDKRGSYDFSASPQNLVLGGGSGEHPGLVIHNLASVVAKYLYFQLSDEEIDTLTEEEEEYVTDLYSISSDDILEFCGWSIRQYADFLRMSSSEALSCPLSDSEDAEDWLIRSIGEIVYFSLPDLNPDHEKLMSIFREFSMGATMRNISCTPPGYPKVAGRKIENGKVKWGIYRWPNKS